MSENDINENATEVPELKIEEDVKETISETFNDDHQAILDDRGLYSLNDGKFLVKVNRIEVRQMMAAWGMISSIFTNIATLDLDYQASSTWFLVFSTAASLSPVSFYKFLITIAELNYKGINHQEREREKVEFINYIQSGLKIEELVDIVNVLYNQEKGRFEELLKKVQTLFGPMIKTISKDFKPKQDTGKKPLI